MSFYDDNRNFIIQKLFKDMKARSVNERQLHYVGSLLEDTRKRLRRSYDNTENKATFFKQAFETIGLYDHDYIFINLFFEEEIDDIMSEIGSYYRRNFEDASGTLLFQRFQSYLNILINPTDFKIENFLKNEFMELICDDDWVWSTKSSWPRPDQDFLRIYAESIIMQLCIGRDDDALYLSIIFNRIWIDDVGFTKNHRNTKAVIFLQALIQEFDRVIKLNIYPDIHNLVEGLHLLFSEVFVANFYPSPLTDGSLNPHYNESYLEKVILFQKRQAISKILNRSHEHETYLELFSQLNVSISDIYVEKSIIRAIRQKIDKGYGISSEDIDSIRELNLTDVGDTSRTEFFRRLYLYEYLSL
jgi:hypothetical protein